MNSCLPHSTLLSVECAIQSKPSSRFKTNARKKTQARIEPGTFTSSVLLKSNTADEFLFQEFISKPEACLWTLDVDTVSLPSLMISRSEIIGGGERDRTDDLLLAKQALSQLSYTPDKPVLSYE